MIVFGLYIHLLIKIVCAFFSGIGILKETWNWYEIIDTFS